MRNPVATVNGQPITRFEFETAVQEYVLQLHGESTDRLSAAERVDLERTALEKLVIWELICQGAEQQRVGIAEADIDEESDRLVGQFTSGEDFLERLASCGVGPEVLRHSVRRDLTVQAMTGRMAAEAAEPSPEEIEAEYRRYLAERADEKPLSLAEATPRIRAFLKERAGISRLREWVAHLRSQAAIEIAQSSSSSQSRVRI